MNSDTQRARINGVDVDVPILGAKPQPGTNAEQQQLIYMQQFNVLIATGGLSDDPAYAQCVDMILSAALTGDRHHTFEAISSYIDIAYDDETRAAAEVDHAMPVLVAVCAEVLSNATAFVNNLIEMEQANPAAMQAAMQQAQARWPRFVAYMQARKEGDGDGAGK